MYHKKSLTNVQDLIHKLYQFYQITCIIKEIQEMTRHNPNEELLKHLKSQILRFYLREK